VEYANPNVLISTEEVAARLGNDDLHLIEVDEDTAAYERGHIPAALALHWRDELQSHEARDVVAKEGFEALMAARGIDQNTEVVLYGGNNNWFAAYGYWYFKLYGHQNVKLLDGGRKIGSGDGAHAAAARPARRPKTTQSSSELPIIRFRPCTPPVISPAANRPSTVVWPSERRRSGPGMRNCGIRCSPSRETTLASVLFPRGAHGRWPKPGRRQS